MEEKKYNCPECGTIMNEVYEKPALNLSCPKCGCKIATTRWEKIDLDDKEYEIILISNNNPTIEQIKAVSNISGENFINSKQAIIKGNLIFKGNPSQVIDIVKVLDGKKINHIINPEFPY